MDMDRFRQVLCECREKLVGSQADLSSRTKTDAYPIPISSMTISAIERGANRNPGVLTVARLVEAMPDLTLSAFFARIEGLPPADSAGQNQTPPPTPVSPADETVPTLSAEEIHTIRAFAKIIRTSADREHEEAESKRRAHRRYSADLGRQQKAAPPDQVGTLRQRTAQRRRLNKKVKPRPKN